MAPSANRRSGHSRRAQYSTFFGYLVGVAGVGFGAFLLTISIWQPNLVSGLTGLAADAAEAPGGAAARGRSAGRDAFSTVSGFFKAATSYGKLERELKEAKVRLAEADGVAAENRRLKRLLGLAQDGPAPVAVTRFVASTATSTRRLATIGAGRSEGIAPGMPVRSVLGLVGRVLHVGASSSQVLLVTDTESLVPVRRATDGVPAFAQGRGDGRLQIKLIDLGLNPIRKGDVFVTSGSGGLYHPGIAIAVAEQLTSDGAIGKVLSDPAATEYVIVDPVWAPEPPAKTATGAIEGSARQ